MFGTKAILTAAIAVVSGGCLTSAFPLAGDAPGETHLAGVWRAAVRENANEHASHPLGMQVFLKNDLAIERHSDSFYETTVAGVTYDIEVSRVGGHRYIDVSPYVEKDSESPPMTLPLHVFFRVEQDGETLKLFPWDVGAFNGLISSGDIPVIRPERERTVMLAPSRKLRQTIAKRPELFLTQPVVFRRVKPE